MGRLYKRLYRKIRATLLTGSVVLCVSGCSASDIPIGTEYKSESSTLESAYDHDLSINSDQMYEYKEIASGANWTEIYDVVDNGEWIYVYGAMTRDADGSSANVYRDMKIVGMKHDGSEINTVYTYTETEDLWGNVSYSTGFGINVDEMTITTQGELIIIKREFTSDAEKYVVAWFDQRGVEQWATVIENAESVGTPIVISEKVYIPCGNRILCYNSKGELLQQLILEMFPEGFSKEDLNLEIEAIYAIENDAYVVWANRMSSLRHVIRTDLKTGEMTDWMETVGVLGADIVPGDSEGHDFLAVETQGIYGWNFGSTDRTELVDFVDSGIIGENVKKVVSVDRESYLMLYTDAEGTDTIGYLEKIDSEALQSRQIIVLGLLSRGNNYVKNIIRFNQESEDYRIVVVDYTKYDEPLTQLGIDIMTKNAPDLYYADASYEIPFDDYARAGVLEDLKLWFGQDQKLNEDDFLINVFDSLGLDGHWYQMPTAIKIYAYLGDSRVFENKQSWTLEDYYKLAAQNAEASVLWGSRESLMRDALIFRWEQFVDKENGKCSFDSEEFIQLLEWLKSFPVEADLSAIDINQVRNGRVYALKTEFRDFTTFNTNLDRLYQHEAEYIGFPSAEGTSGMCVASGLTLAMSSQSENKEGAWEFIRYFFTDEYQVDVLTTISEQLPVKLSALEILADRAMNPALGILDSYHLNGREITVEPPSEEMVDEWMAFIQTIAYADTLDDELYNIITEETAAYFTHQKAASVVAESIQSRIGIYLAEQQ